MNPLITELPLVHLKQGELHLSEKPELVFTILGSCISIVMYCARTRQAAICHSLLPQDKGRIDKDRIKNDNFKYLDQSFYTMHKWFVRRRVKNYEIVVKVFGAGDVLQSKGCKEEPCIKNKTIGALNIDAAHRFIKEMNLNIAAIDVGGDIGRKLFFYTHTGEVLIKRLKKAEAITVL